jgi:hypothetical protein
MKSTPSPRLAGNNPQPVQRPRISQPPAGSLRHLSVRGQVAVPALRLHRLALQVARAPAASGRTYARRGHHISDDRERPKAAKNFAQRSHSGDTAVHLMF